MSEIILESERRGQLPQFIARRSRFEEFIQKHRALINQIVRKFGTKDSGQSHLKKFYEVIFGAIDDQKSDQEIVDRLVTNKDFTYLQPNESPYAGVSATRYSTQVKSGLVVSELLPSAQRCSICGGLVPSQAITIDHKTRLADGGESSVDNLQIAHGYCNSGIKEAQVSRETRS